MLSIQYTFSFVHLFVRIRALFGKDASQNATHGSDSEASFKKETDFIFSDSLLDVAAAPTDAGLHHPQNDGIVPATMPIINEDTPVVTDAAPEEAQTDTTTEHKNDARINNTEIIEEHVEDTIEQEKQVQNSAVVDTQEKITSAATDNLDIVASVVNSNDEENSSTDPTDKKENSSATAKIEQILPVASDISSLPVDTEATHTDGNKENVVCIEEKRDEVSPVENKEVNVLPVEEKKVDVLPIEEKKMGVLPVKDKKLDVFPVEENTLEENGMSMEDKKESLSVENNADELEEISLTDENKVSSVLDDDVSEAKNDAADIAQEDTDATIPDIPQDKPNTCIELTPDASLKDEDIISSDNTVSVSVIIDNQNEVVPSNTIIPDAETITITPPAEREQAASTNSSASLNDSEDKEILTKPKKTLKKTQVKKEAIIPSSSRIRPPSIKRGQDGSMIQSGEPIGRSRLTSNKISSANSSAGTTRIARLSPSATIRNEPVAATEKKKMPVTRDVPKKPLTKVSKNLPRVATMAAPKPATTIKEEDNEGEKKTKKRGSSTKSFISRLTAPTVASQNKKADSDTTATAATTGVSRRTTMSGKRNSAVRPASSTSKVY